MKLCVLGLGYIGLPTAVMFANSGITVVGVDTDPNVVHAVNNKIALMEEAELAERLSSAVEFNYLRAYEKPQKADAFIITVPTPVNEDKSADLSFVKEAVESILPYLEKGNLVVVESTVPPRTLLDVVCPILERSGLELGQDLYVAYSPERVILGKVFYELEHNSRVIGGINDISTIKTKELYEKIVKGKLLLTDATTAELVKVIENTYRDVNIAFANELVKLAEKIGVNVWEAIEFANHHPRVNIHQPGPGVGGHCIAVDPWFLVELAPEITKLVHQSRLINDEMPLYIAMKVQKILNENHISKAKVAVLGLAFKANIDDCRESPSFEVIRRLEELGLQCVAYDPRVKTMKLDCQVPSLEDAFKGADMAVVLVGHDQFKKINVKEIKQFMNHHIVFDTRNSIDLKEWRKEGFKTYLLGKNGEMV